MYTENIVISQNTYDRKKKTLETQIVTWIEDHKYH